MTLRDVVDLAVRTNPAVGEVRAVRRASTFELDQAKSGYFPTVDLSARGGYERIDRPFSLSAEQNDKWVDGADVSLIVRQTLFDGFQTANSVYQAAARVDAASYRVLERSELTALDATEAFLDILRHGELITAARNNIAIQQELLGLAEAKYSGGSATEGEVSQARERLAAAQAAEVDIRKAYSETVARFEVIVGVTPGKLVGPKGLTNLPKSKGEAIELAKVSNPTVKAADADADAARYAIEVQKGEFVPTIGAEGRATYGRDIDAVEGKNNEYEARLTLNWRLFDGGRRSARYSELVERQGAAEQRLDLVRRQAVEAANRAWIARASGVDRVSILDRQLGLAAAAARSFRKEYEAGTRTLIDLLDAQNSVFNVRIQLIGARYARAFADYQLLAATGGLLAYLNIEKPPEGLPETRASYGLATPSGVYIEPLRKY